MPSYPQKKERKKKSDMPAPSDSTSASSGKKRAKNVLTLKVAVYMILAEINTDQK